MAWPFGMEMFPNCVNAKSIKKPAKKYLSGIWSWGGRSISGVKLYS
jgi:hypothetical protein